MLPLENAARKNIENTIRGKKVIKKVLAAFSRGNIVKMNFETLVVFCNL
jgi:hypothetical protein